MGYETAAIEDAETSRMNKTNKIKVMIENVAIVCSVLSVSSVAN